MLEAAIIKTIKTVTSNVHFGYLPEKATGVVVSVISTRTLPQLRRTNIRRREAIINLKIFESNLPQIKDLQYKLLRLLEDVQLDVEVPGYRYEMLINVQNLNDMFIGQDKFSQLDISVQYYEHPTTT
ncbi:hypothetical protein C5B78_00970 [Aeromonas salmonicida]|nr:hypothetical protein C5B78_00970 [Aeromonas salmonicida]